ncbi:MAG: hypothetical protein SFX73_03060 [Kofleriaceae bacterium]|nr:hypothetical protein [Kofleriaceae bacterium]
MKWIAYLSLVACSSSSPAPERPVVAPVVADAAEPDAPPPDTGPPQAVLDAPAWVFRYATAERTETWTLRHAEGAALLEVQNAQGTQRYLGTATDGASLMLDVTTGTAKMALDCKRAKRALSTKCNDTRAKKLDVLDCYHPDFKEPMPFGPAPGVEYAVDARCTGYRLIAP